jgi:hypothetical protein
MQFLATVMILLLTEVYSVFVLRRLRIRWVSKVSPQLQGKTQITEGIGYDVFPGTRPEAIGIEGRDNTKLE